jgi:hypothetical protein
MADAPASVRTLAADRGLTRLRPAGGGVEFQVFEATAPDGSRGNGLDYEAVLNGYGEPVPVDSAAFWIYRLDAAVMLALLFSAEVPHAGLGPRAVDRLREVHLRLSRELSR